MSYKQLSGNIIEIKDIKCAFSSKEGVILSSYISSEIQKLKTNIKFNGKINEFSGLL